MSITAALNTAMTGLRAAGRGAEVVSSNISNALTPGYGRRELALSAASGGVYGGVRIDGITRAVDPGLAADRRLAEAETGDTGARAEFLSRIERLVGTPDDPGALTARLAAFETSLVTAASRPEAPERLNGAVSAARELAQALTDTARGVQTARTDADRAIAAQVTELNGALEEVEALNRQITAVQMHRADSAALQDQRQQLIDRIGTIVPVREVARDHGQVALYTQGGAVLIDGRASEIGFQQVNLVTADMTIEGGALNGLTLNGKAIRTDSEHGVLNGGTLGAQFAIRDELGPDAQVQIDALARDLVERFQDPNVDPTLSPGDAGLFTDAGNAFDPAEEVGLAQRLAVNAAVDPAQGGAAWRLRDGLNAPAQGDVGDASLLRALADTLTYARTPASGGFGGGAHTATGLASTYLSDVVGQRVDAERKLTYATTRLTELTERQLAEGVDTDDELRRLMLVEQAYAANARVIQTVDELMQTILGL
jgi:flagellar hook-associated protein 1